MSIIFGNCRYHLKRDIEKQLLALNIDALLTSLEQNLRINFRQFQKFQPLLERVKLLKQSAGTDHMGCIDLQETPVLNPLFYPIYKNVLDVIEKLAKSGTQAALENLQKILPAVEKPKDFLNKGSKSPEFRKKFLECLQLEPLIAHLEEESATDPRKAVANRLQLTDLRNLRDQYTAKTLDVLLLKCLPVLPPQYRPKHKIEDGRITSLYLTRFYEEILRHQVKDSDHAPQKNLPRRRKGAHSSGKDSDHAPQKKYKWQQISRQVFGLFQNRYIKNAIGQIEKSLESFLKGKTGIFRRNLLGKRCDFSARATIVVNPTLGIDECLLPETIALPLFEPLIWWEMKKKGETVELEFLKALKDRKSATPVVQETIRHRLEDSMRDYPVLLNRNPTLHRMGIMGFNARLKETDSHTISINPLVTTPFGADFDGDGMALFMPMLDRSSEDVRCMMASNHIFSPANGNLLVSISQDIVLGVYLHYRKEDWKNELSAILGCPVPKTPLRRQELIRLIEAGNANVLECLTKLKDFGFRVATEHGCTYSLWDLWEIAMGRQTLEDMDVNAKNDELIEATDEHIKQTLAAKDNAIAWSFLSGARGNEKQMRKMVGGIWEIDSIDGAHRKQRIHSNLTHGLALGEYVYSVYEGRKTQVDQQLATPRAGWLTRKLIYATQHLTITDEEGRDCGSDQCLSIAKNRIMEEQKKKPYNLIGRWYETANGEIREITPDELNSIRASAEETLRIRSPIFCHSEKGICQKCYGWDLSTKAAVESGTRVGIIASQSIGERSTQASLSARHGGGGENDLESIIKFFNGEIPENVGMVATDLLHAIFKMFDGKVDIKHFEVVLRSMLQRECVDDVDQWIISALTGILPNRPGWLANLAFDRPFVALRDAVIEKATDSLEGPLENLLVSHFN